MLPTALLERSLPGQTHSLGWFIEGNHRIAKPSGGSSDPRRPPAEPFITQESLCLHGVLLRLCQRRRQSLAPRVTVIKNESLSSLSLHTADPIPLQTPIRWVTVEVRRGQEIETRAPLPTLWNFYLRIFTPHGIWNRDKQ